MFDGLNNSGWPVLLTIAVAVMCAVVGCREILVSRRAGLRYLWPTFWFLTAVLLAVMAIGQASDIGNLISDLGRREAQSYDWYENRRSAQTVIVSLVAAVWAIVVLVAIWRVPERRRRYLPMAIIVFTLVCFGAIRVVSLHHIDAVVYRRHLGSVQIGRVIEYFLLTLAFVVAAAHLRVVRRTDENRVGTPITTS